MAIIITDFSFIKRRSNLGKFPVTRSAIVANVFQVFISKACCPKDIFGISLAKRSPRKDLNTLKVVTFHPPVESVSR